MGVYSLAKSSIKNWAKYPNLMAGSTELSSDWLISQTVLSSTTASVTFDVSGLAAQGFKHLQIRIAARNANAAPGATVNYGANGVIRFNSDSASNYRSHYLEGSAPGSTVNSGDYGSTTGVYLPDLGGVWDSTAANIFSVGIVDILDFASSSKNKTLRSLGGNIKVSNGRVDISSGVWFSTSPVTSIVISEDGASTGFKAGSRFSLYGIKG